jgi:hypothetical protein
VIEKNIYNLEIKDNFLIGALWRHVMRGGDEIGALMEERKGDGISVFLYQIQEFSFRISNA